jgi:hypothetical protein
MPGTAMMIGTMALLFGVFDGFKGATTLLLWGDDRLPDLRDLSRHLATGRSPAIDLEDIIWARAPGDCAVRISHTREAAHGLRQRRDGEQTRVECGLTNVELNRFADLIDALLPHPNGHQYLDLDVPDQPLQIIVSKGEYTEGYPPRMRPMETLAGDRAG